ncbi:MAG TPA: translation initiation factor IF-2 [Opitutaceae bacterium]|nr:translation initiation factor IF-2 [Opitutaceae bacterium]
MSVRIHELAKRIDMDNKELLALLKARGFEVKTASSAIDPISAESIEKEFKSARPAATATTTEEPPVEAAPTQPVAVRPPQGAFVKTASDIERERAAIEAAKPKAIVMPPPAVRAPFSAAPRPRPIISPLPASRIAPVSPAPRVAPAAAPQPQPAPVHIPQPAPRMAPPPPQARPVAPTVSSPVTPPPPPQAEAKPAASGDVKLLSLKTPIIVREFATAIGLRPFKLISELMEVGIFASLNQAIDEPVAIKLAEKHGFLLEVKHRGDVQPVQPTQKKAEKPVEEDESKLLEPRPPVVCILGHVDHGKTTLLDSIRKANVAAGEAGGITQHIGAYQVDRNGRKITFLDTPGHAAFNKMRSRGANSTDIAILVVAADDGFMPQTDEALKYAKEAKVAIIVAINKSDVKGANVDRVKLQMQERGIPSEDWGGETIAVPVSALKGDGIENLLENILLQADVLELKANPKAPASGVVIEAEIEVGRGSTATVIVERGTLKMGDALVCGSVYTKVKALFDDKGEAVKSAGPATPVKVIGWSGPPEAGAKFKAVKNEREAKNIAEESAQVLKNVVTGDAAVPKDTSIDALFASIAATQKRMLKVVLKCDVFGSVEAVRGMLEGIKSDKVGLEVVAAEVGLVSKNDVLLASTSGSLIIGFNTKNESGAVAFAKHHGVTVQHYQIIYELADKVKEALADLLEPDLKEVKLGGAEVRATFPIAKGFVAGCLVTDGKITRNAKARVRRGKEIIHESSVSTLRRFKDDANEVRAGLECGIRLDGFDGYEQGDIIECYEVQKIRATL